MDNLIIFEDTVIFELKYIKNGVKNIKTRKSYYTSIVWKLIFNSIGFKN